MARFLVTGGAGFIGSHIVDELLCRGESVRIADDFSTGRRERVPPTVDVVEGDLADGAVARRAVGGCEFVLHHAALPSVPRSILNPVSSNRSNVDVTLQILTAARDAGVRRVVFAGSSAVYAPASPFSALREDAASNPTSPYGLQKLMGERYCQLFT